MIFASIMYNMLSSWWLIFQKMLYKAEIKTKTKTKYKNTLSKSLEQVFNYTKVRKDIGEIFVC